jgi:hypothetical protein
MHARPLPSHRRPRRWCSTWSDTRIRRYSNPPRRIPFMHQNRSPRDVMPPSRHQSPQAREWPLGSGVQVTSADRRKAHPPSPGPEKYAATDKEWFSEALAISSAKVVSSVADKIVDHDGMMLDEFNNVVSDLGDEMRAEMKELRAELRALVVAKVSAQEKEIRELRGMVLSLAKKTDGGRASSPPPPPPARKAKGDGKSPQAPSYAQAAAPRSTQPHQGPPPAARESQPKPRPVQQGDVAILQRPLPSTIPDSQPMEGVEFSVQSLNASKHAPATIPIPSSPPPK